MSKGAIWSIWSIPTHVPDWQIGVKLANTDVCSSRPPSDNSIPSADWYVQLPSDQVRRLALYCPSRGSGFTRNAPLVSMQADADAGAEQADLYVAPAGADGIDIAAAH